MRNVSDLTDKAFESIQHLRVGDFILPYRELPSAAIAAVENLTGIFDVGTPAERAAIAQRVDRSFAFVFERYAHSGAVESVRRNDPSLIKRGLVALALENAKVDWRDTLPVAALLHNSAVRLKTDASGLFASIGEIAQPPMRGILSSYVSPQNRGRSSPTTTRSPAREARSHISMLNRGLGFPQELSGRFDRCSGSSGGDFPFGISVGSCSLP